MSLDNELKENKKRMKTLEQWLEWCLDNCDDSPEHNFGIGATQNIRALLRGENVNFPD